MQKHVILQQYFISWLPGLLSVMHMARVALLHHWIPFLSSPTCEFSVKGKEVLWVCLVAPGISCLFFFFSFVVAAFSICVAIKKKITRYTDDSHQLVFQALEKKRLSEN